MQQKRQKNLSRNIKSPFFKIRRWCRRHRISPLLLPVVGVLLIGVAILIIGGLVLDWDIVGVLMSPTTFLIVTILFAVAIGYAYHRATKGR